MENNQNMEMQNAVEAMEMTSAHARKKQRIILAAVLVICMAIFATGTLAFFTAEETAYNVITTGILSMDLVEETTGGEPWPDGGISGAMPGMEVDKVPYVKNDGGIDFWTRIYVSVTVTGRGGEELSDEYITQRDIETFAAGRLPSNIYTPTFHVYTFTSHFGVPDIKVVNAEGTEGVLIADEGSENGWHMDLEYQDERIKPKMEERVLKAAKSYATFVSEDTTRAGILQYVLKGSEAEKKINAYDNDWFTPHARYHFSHEVTHNYYLFADNCFSVDVQMAFHMSSSNGKETAYPCVYRLYWGYSEAKEQWLIFDFDLLSEYDYDLHNAVDAQAKAAAQE